MRKSTEKYSNSYYYKIRMISLGVILLATLTIFIVSAAYTYNQTLKGKQASMKEENKKISQEITETLEVYQYVCLSLANYTIVSPIFQDVSQNLMLQKATLQNELDTLYICHEYISGIYMEMQGYSVSVHAPDADTEFTEFADYETHTLSYSSPEEYPKLIKIEYTSEKIQPYKVAVYLKAIEIGKTFLGDDNFLITEGGDIICAGDERIVENLKEYHPVSLKYRPEEELTTAQSLIYSTSLLDNNAFLVSIQPRKGIMREILLTLIYYFTITAIFIFIAVILVNRTLRRLYAPISEVAQTFQYLLPQEGKALEADAIRMRKYLAITMNNNNNNNILNESQRRGLVQIRSMQIKTLNSQISPHFLGNALTVIQHEIGKILGLDNHVRDSITIFGKMLRRAARYHHIIVPLSSEIAQTKEYLQIAEFCFLKNLKTEWEVDPSLENCAVISNTLQPIIENAVVHGFSDSPEQPKINIIIEPDGGDILIAIYDNGNGIDEETLSTIKKSVYDEQNESDHHIGLWNVHQRIRLLFGERYGIIKIQSNSTGTFISVLIPHYPYNEKER